MKATFLLALLLAAALAAEEEAPLAQRLESAEAGVATQALFDLAKRGPPGSQREIEVVRMHLSSENANLRVAAASAAASLHDDGAVPQLIAAMRNAGEGGEGDAFQAALTTIAGGDKGGGDPDKWSAWHDGIIAVTQATCSRIRLGMQDGKIDEVRAALHPLLMQRAGRDLVVDMLEELGKGTDPRLVALAREGLSAIDTAAARVALADLDRTLPAGSTTSAAGVAQAVIDEVGLPKTPPKSAPAAPPKPQPPAGTGFFQFLFMLLTAGVLAVGGWFAGRHWLELKAKAKKATQRFVRKKTMVRSGDQR